MGGIARLRRRHGRDHRWSDGTASGKAERHGGHGGSGCSGETGSLVNHLLNHLVNQNPLSHWSGPRAWKRFLRRPSLSRKLKIAHLGQIRQLPAGGSRSRHSAANFIFLRGSWFIFASGFTGNERFLPRFWTTSRPIYSGNTGSRPKRTDPLGVSREAKLLPRVPPYPPTGFSPWKSPFSADLRRLSGLRPSKT